MNNGLIKRGNLLVASLVLSLTVVFSLVAHCSPTTFWIAPNGNDSWPGTRLKPFHTLEWARNVVRKVNGRPGNNGEIVVYLKEGTYRLESPLVLDSSDSGRNGHDVVYRAETGAHPIISGSIRVQGWTLHDKALNIYKAHVGEYKSRQLYVDGQRARRAQTDPYPAGFLPSPIIPAHVSDAYVIGGSIEYKTTPLNPERWNDPARWSNVKNIEAVILTQWKMMIVPLDSITSHSETGQIFLQQPGWTNANLYFGSDNKPGIWSFWRVTRFENAYEFLHQPGDWYLDEAKGWIYYIPRAGENLATADVELPVLEVLVDGQGQRQKPVSNIRFEGLTFSYATWLSPSGSNGYVSDQSGFRLVGNSHKPNIIGHDQDVIRTPGNVRVRFGHKITFRDNTFEHLGGVGLDFDTGSQGNVVKGNQFRDISSAAIQLGGVSKEDHHPKYPAQQITRDNIISNNTIHRAGREFNDAAGVFVGFTKNTLISHNTMTGLPWSGIAMGWGWGLLDKGMFPGVPGAKRGQWGTYTTPTPNSGNRILGNRISNFLNVLWDGGAIYTTGQQGTSMGDALLIEGNVASGRSKDSSKSFKGGGNTFYTDGGSRYIKVKNNVSVDNPIGNVDLGPSPKNGDPYQNDPRFLVTLGNIFKYGSDSGGCRTYGDIHFDGNYWLEGFIPIEEFVYGLTDYLLGLLLAYISGKPPESFDPYGPHGFFDVCPYSENGVSYPTRLTYWNNHWIPNNAMRRDSMSNPMHWPKRRTQN